MAVVAVVALEGVEVGVVDAAAAATGSGKTGVAAGPHLLPCMKGRVTIFTSPLIALQNEQVCAAD